MAYWSEPRRGFLNGKRAFEKFKGRVQDVKERGPSNCQESNSAQRIMSSSSSSCLSKDLELFSIPKKGEVDFATIMVRCKDDLLEGSKIACRSGSKIVLSPLLPKRVLPSREKKFTCCKSYNVNQTAFKTWQERKS